MKLLLLLSITVALVATGANGLKCYVCVLKDDCTNEMECASGMDACLKTSGGEKEREKVWKTRFSDVAAAAASPTEHQIEIREIVLQDFFCD